MCDQRTGVNQGIYQWASREDAENYAKSFAVRFMTGRSEHNSISYKIIANKNIYDYLAELKI
ncbi:MAG: hypothetical protein HN730_06885 [Bdellovibrionales bacterium]|nr:hypothetical protein [Bdellovibrionales bacterium]